MRISIAKTLLPFLFVGCVSSELKLAGNDPGHPGAATRPLAASSNALAPDFDPLASAAPAPEPAADAGPPVDAGTQKYTCPMHPEIIKDEPGICPLCKMKLVPVKEKHSHPGVH